MRFAIKRVRDNAEFICRKGLVYYYCHLLTIGVEKKSEKSLLKCSSFALRQSISEATYVSILNVLDVVT